MIKPWGLDVQKRHGRQSGTFDFLPATIMSNPHLPAEILDDIVDHLHDTKDALKSCCLASKSWVERARKHLFSYVAFRSPKQLQSWKTAFPDPSISPARYTTTLFVKFPQVVTPADAKEGGWILTFSRVVRLEISVVHIRNFEPLSLFHGFSPVIRSLRIVSILIPSSHFLNLICSFPLLEDLSVITEWLVEFEDISDTQPTLIQPSKPPSLTGSLELYLPMGVSLLAPTLLSLPSGPHFKQLDLVWSSDEDMSLTAALVEKCHHTLERLCVSLWPGTSVRHSHPHTLVTLTPFAGCPMPRPIDLSKATELKEMALPCKSHPQWIVTTLQTITNDHKHFRQITLDNLDLDRFDPADSTPREWSELDRSLFRLWTSHSIQIEVTYDGTMPKDKVRMCLESLLPEFTRGGEVEPISRESQL